MPKLSKLPFLSLFLFLTALLAISLPARAGDAATLEILGFSADGGIFAFEEHGVQDGSGFPYANRFYIDTATDKFVPGTPVRVRLENDGATLAQARAEAREKSQGIIADEVLAANRGFAAGANEPGELSADPHRMAVNPRPIFPPADDPLEFRIQEYPAPPPNACGDLGEIIMGFRLLNVPVAEGRTVRLLHEDKSIPTSRGCPLGYMLAAVQTFFPQAGDPVFAVLIAVRGFGFEGPDHRYMAVTGKFAN